MKSHTKTINLKYQPQHKIKSLNCLMDHYHFYYQIFKIILIILSKKHEAFTDNPPKKKDT